MISGLSTCAADKQKYPFYLAKSKFMLKYIIEFSSCFFPFGTRIFLRGYRMSVYQLHLSHWHRIYFDISYMHKLPFSWGKWELKKQWRSINLKKIEMKNHNTQSKYSIDLNINYKTLTKVAEFQRNVNLYSAFSAMWA